MDNDAFFKEALWHQPFKRQSYKMVKHTQTIRQQQLTNCLSVFDHFVKLVLKGLSLIKDTQKQLNKKNKSYLLFDFTQ